MLAHLKSISTRDNLPSQFIKSGQVFAKGGVGWTKSVALQYARPRRWDHEELLDGGRHVAGGSQVEETHVAALAATLLPGPVLPRVRLVAGRLKDHHDYICHL